MEKRNQNNQQSQKDLKYINVPLSIVKKRWFKGRMPCVRGSSTHGMPLCPVMMPMLWSRDRRFTLQRGDYMHTKLSFRVFGYQRFYGKK